MLGVPLSPMTTFRTVSLGIESATAMKRGSRITRATPVMTAPFLRASFITLAAMSSSALLAVVRRSPASANERSQDRAHALAGAVGTT